MRELTTRTLVMVLLAALVPFALYLRQPQRRVSAIHLPRIADALQAAHESMIGLSPARGQIARIRMAKVFGRMQLDEQARKILDKLESNETESKEVTSFSHDELLTIGLEKAAAFAELNDGPASIGALEGTIDELANNKTANDQPANKKPVDEDSYASDELVLSLIARCIDSSAWKSLRRLVPLRNWDKFQPGNHIYLVPALQRAVRRGELKPIIKLTTGTGRRPWDRFVSLNLAKACRLEGQFKLLGPLLSRVSRDLHAIEPPRLRFSLTLFLAKQYALAQESAKAYKRLENLALLPILSRRQGKTMAIELCRAFALVDDYERGSELAVQLSVNLGSFELDGSLDRADNAVVFGKKHRAMGFIKKFEQDFEALAPSLSETQAIALQARSAALYGRLRLKAQALATLDKAIGRTLRLVDPNERAKALLIVGEASIEAAFVTKGKSLVEQALALELDSARLLELIFEHHWHEMLLENLEQLQFKSSGSVAALVHAVVDLAKTPELAAAAAERLIASLQPNSQTDAKVTMDAVSKLATDGQERLAISLALTLDEGPERVEALTIIHCQMTRQGRSLSLRSRILLDRAISAN